MGDNAFSSGVEVAQQAQQRRAMLKQQQDLKGLEFLKTFRPMLEEAANIEDPTLRKNTLGDLMEGYSRQFGQKVDPAMVNWMHKNPEQFQSVLKMAHDENLRIDQIFPMLANPMIRGSVSIALNKAQVNRETGGLMAGDSVPSTATPTAPQTSAPTIGSGDNTPSAPLGAPATPVTAPVAAPAVAAPATAAPEQSPVVAPTAVLDARVQQLEAQRASLQSRMSRIAKIDRKAPGLAILNQQLTNVTEQLFKLREQPALDTAKQSNEPLTAPEVQDLRDAYPKYANRFVAGMSRKSRDALVDTITAETPGTTATGAASAPEAVTPALTTPGKEAQKAEITRRAQSLAGMRGGDGLLREPEIQRLGITTVGQFEDAKASGRLQGIRTPWDVASTTANASAEAAASRTDLEAINLSGNAARKKLPMYDAMAAAANHLGPSGEWVTPIRTQANNLAQMFGVTNPEMLSSKVLIDKLQSQLAVEMTGQMKGQQSNRELEVAMRASPGLFASNQGFAILVAIGREVERQNLAHDQQARRWQAEHHSLYGTDSYGRTFQQAWDDNLAQWYKDNGNIGERVASYFNSDPKDILRGQITPKKKR